MTQLSDFTRTSIPKTSESDLAKKVISWLSDQHWDIYQEVMFSSFYASDGIADIVAVRAGILWVIETKTTLNLTVMEQAARWPAHYRSIAVPASERLGGRGLAYDIAKNYLHIGVLEVKNFDIIQVVQPKLMRENHKLAKHMISRLKDEHKHYSAAGSNSGGYYTPYKSTMNNVRYFIQKHPNCTLKEIMTDLQHHYASDSSARSCIRIALDSWESSWCKVTRAPDGKTCLYSLKDRV